jgi:hypothetical protein
MDSWPGVSLEHRNTNRDGNRKNLNLFLYIFDPLPS